MINEQITNWIGAKTPEQKKGNPTWKPANVIDVINKEPGYRYRIIEKSPRNLAKKEAEGWELLSGLSGKTSMESGYGRINDGTPLTSVLEGHDYVIGRMPEELAKSRDEYVNAKTDRMTKALKREAEGDLRKKGASAHGDIVLERRGIKQVIE